MLFRLCCLIFSHQKKIKFFEGWYFKHQNADTVLAFIPGHSVDEKGYIGRQGQLLSHRLLATDQGKMVRFIKEEHLLLARFLLYKEKELIFDLTSDHVSFEYAPGPENG